MYFRTKQLLMTKEEALNKCAALCSKAEKCTFEILKKLARWELTEQESAWVILQLTSQKFIDDERYAHYFVRDKFRFNKWGKTKIAFQLRQKQISQEVISAALEEINEEEYIDLAKELISAKIPKTKGKNQWDINSKIIRFMQGRGFDYSLTMSLLNMPDE
ncbi:RecX family transcriptional regulator [Puteibacter caeruleilacunae]|nr:RecX family transcriptional regulator [Puteibacter caeruleilacunae]